MTETGETLSILCVDDNPDVADAVRTKLSRARGFEWRGSLTQADDLADVAARNCPALVIHGRLEFYDGVTNIVATDFEPIGVQTVQSRDFR